MPPLIPPAHRARPNHFPAYSGVGNDTPFIAGKGTGRVLEIGTGSGYQSAFLAEYSKDIHGGKDKGAFRKAKNET
jgi:protein-L-isoaspartate O-methyltransferase